MFIDYTLDYSHMHLLATAGQWWHILALGFLPWILMAFMAPGGPIGS